jgi:hypothetical protein
MMTNNIIEPIITNANSSQGQKDDDIVTRMMDRLRTTIQLIEGNGYKQAI